MRRPTSTNYKQGLTVDAVSNIGLYDKNSYNLGKCLQGVGFPAPMHAIRAIKSSDRFTMAISRSYAIRSFADKTALYIEYKFYGRIGIISKGKPKLISNFKYLQEEVDKLWNV